VRGGEVTDTGIRSWCRVGAEPSAASLRDRRAAMKVGPVKAAGMRAIHQESTALYRSGTEEKFWSPASTGRSLGALPPPPPPPPQGGGKVGLFGRARGGKTVRVRKDNTSPARTVVLGFAGVGGCNPRRNDLYPN